jgi:ribosomal protein L11 methyltransferase
LKVKINACPYKNLFIYHVDGVFSHEHEKKLGRKFIGNWVEDDYSFLFFAEDPGIDIEKILNRQSDINLLDKYSFSYEEWQGGGLERNRIENFIIIPPWEEVDTDTGKYEIILDPGVVFGNGLHPTTKDCIRAVSYLKSNYSFKKVVDIGTGTGILAICSVILGANDVVAIDLNPLAVKTASKNVDLNKLGNIIKVFEGKAEDNALDKADLLIANIHFDVIKSMFLIKGFLNKKHFIFSGLMRSQSKEVKDLIIQNGLKILKEWEYDLTWYTILAGRTENG